MQHREHDSMLQQALVPGPAHKAKYWYSIKVLQQNLKRIRRSEQPNLTVQLPELQLQYQNFALYTACRADVRAGRRQRRFTVNLKLFSNGGIARALRIISTLDKQLVIPGWWNRFIFFTLTKSRDETHAYYNVALIARTTLNPLHPTRLPATRLRLD